MGAGRTPEVEPPAAGNTPAWFRASCLVAATTWHPMFSRFPSPSPWAPGTAAHLRGVHLDEENWGAPVAVTPQGVSPSLALPGGPGGYALGRGSAGRQMPCPPLGPAASCPGQWAGRTGCVAVGRPLHRFPGRGAPSPVLQTLPVRVLLSRDLRSFRSTLGGQAPAAFAAAPAPVGILSLHGSKVASV